MNSLFWMNYNLQRFLQFYDCQDFDARIKTDGFPIEIGVLRKNTSIEFLSEEIKPVGKDDCECHYPDEKTLLPLFWKPRTIRTLLQGKKRAFFWMESLLKTVSFWLEFWRKESSK